MHIFLISVINIVVFCMGATMFAFLNFVARNISEEKSVFQKKAVCKYCGHEHKFGDDVPIISFIRFKGTCRYCGEKRSVRDFVVEILGGLFGVGAIFFYGIKAGAIIMFCVTCVLALITLVDMDTQEIPPQFNFILLCLGVISYFVMDGPDLKERIIGLFAISVPMLLLALVGGFGGGDVKLMFAAGFLLGWKGIVMAFFIGAILGGVFAIYLLATKKMGRKDRFAFGPFLSVGILISMVQGFGASLVQMYIDYIKHITS